MHYRLNTIGQKMYKACPSSVLIVNKVTIFRQNYKKVHPPQIVKGQVSDKYWCDMYPGDQVVTNRGTVHVAQNKSTQSEDKYSNTSPTKQPTTYKHCFSFQIRTTSSSFFCTSGVSVSRSSRGSLLYRLYHVSLRSCKTRYLVHLVQF